MRKTTFKIEELAQKAEKIDSMVNIICQAFEVEYHLSDEMFISGLSLLSDITNQFNNDMQAVYNEIFEEEKKQAIADEANILIKKQFCKSADEMLATFKKIKENSPACTDTNE